MVPRKVFTPGSQPSSKPGKKKSVGVSPGGGRPSTKSDKVKKGYSRKGNYRHKYKPEALMLALAEVRDKRMSVNMAANHFGIPKTTLFDTPQKKIFVTVPIPGTVLYLPFKKKPRILSLFLKFSKIDPC